MCCTLCSAGNGQHITNETLQSFLDMRRPGDCVLPYATQKLAARLSQVRLKTVQITSELQPFDQPVQSHVAQLCIWSFQAKDLHLGGQNYLMCCSGVCSTGPAFLPPVPPHVFARFTLCFLFMSCLLFLLKHLCLLLRSNLLMLSQPLCNYQSWPWLHWSLACGGSDAVLVLIVDLWFLKLRPLHLLMCMQTNTKPSYTEWTCSCMFTSSWQVQAAWTYAGAGGGSQVGLSCWGAASPSHPVYSQP